MDLRPAMFDGVSVGGINILARNSPASFCHSSKMDWGLVNGQSVLYEQ